MNGRGTDGARIEELYVYPLKSARGIRVDSVDVDEGGLRHDRRWMFVDEQGRFLSQRSHPRMAFLRVVLSGDVLRISSAEPGGPRLSDLELPLEVSESDAGKLDPVRIWYDDRPAWDCGAEAALWATEFMGVPCRVARAPESGAAPVLTEEGRLLHGFADAAPALAISVATLEDLNRRLERPVPMNRFRPNLVVSGVEAYAEDGWTKVHIGEVGAQATYRCPRCVLVTVDQDTGTKGDEPLRTLARYRRTEDGSVPFGMNIRFDGSGVLHVGDPVAGSA